MQDKKWYQQSLNPQFRANKASLEANQNLSPVSQSQIQKQNTNPHVNSQILIHEGDMRAELSKSKMTENFESRAGEGKSRNHHEQTDLTSQNKSQPKIQIKPQSLFAHAKIHSTSNRKLEPVLKDRSKRGYQNVISKDNSAINHAQHKFEKAIMITSSVKVPNGDLLQVNHSNSLLDIDPLLAEPKPEKDEAYSRKNQPQQTNIIESQNGKRNPSQNKPKRNNTQR